MKVRLIKEQQMGKFGGTGGRNNTNGKKSRNGNEKTFSTMAGTTSILSSNNPLGINKRPQYSTSSNMVQNLGDKIDGKDDTQEGLRIQNKKV